MMIVFFGGSKKHKAGVGETDKQYRKPVYQISKNTIVDIWNAANVGNTNKHAMRIIVTDITAIEYTISLIDEVNCWRVADVINSYDKYAPHDINIPLKKLYIIGKNVRADSIYNVLFCFI